MTGEKTQAKQSRGVHFKKNSMRSLYNHHILAAEKLENIDSNKTELQGTIITSLM